ncbi:hypothetical protein MKEN_00564700 [Mycena kentingensis (nom. inval.)]|nr:hypothetical protein MKEN_00564700 [Mycena kentingensis (nom. inval.)]
MAAMLGPTPRETSEVVAVAVRNPFCSTNTACAHSSWRLSPSSSSPARALLNVTVDDTDAEHLTYAGIWDPSVTHQSSLDFGGSHTFSSDESARAVFEFTGVAVYYLAPRWPYPVDSRVSLDGGAAVVVNLTDPVASTTDAGGSESAMWSIAWFAEGLRNTSHRVVVSIGPTGYIVVDGWMYTVDNGTAPSSSASSSFASSTSATLAASSASPSLIFTQQPHSANKLTVGLAIALGLAVLVAALLLGFAWLQRKKNRRRHSLMPKPMIDYEDDGLGSGGSAAASTWGSVQRGTRRLFGGGGGARGAYAPVQELSEVGAGAAVSAYPYVYAPQSADPAQAPLVPNRRGASRSGSSYAPVPVRTDPFVDPWEPDAGYDPHAPLAHSHSQSSSQSSLPPGARAPTLPGPYPDRALPAPPPETTTSPTTTASQTTWAPSSTMILPNHPYSASSFSSSTAAAAAASSSRTPTSPITQTQAHTATTSPSAYSAPSASAPLTRAGTVTTAGSRIVFAAASDGAGAGDGNGDGEEVRIRPPRLVGGGDRDGGDVGVGFGGVVAGGREPPIRQVSDPPPYES